MTNPHRFERAPVSWTHFFVGAAERSYHQSLAVARLQSAIVGGISIYWRPADHGRTDMALCPVVVSLSGAGRLAVRHRLRVQRGDADRLLGTG
jgi:hypothetical protein